MSGDLKNPGKSIPKGTFLAIGTGYLIYMGLPILLASRADALTLIDDPLIMKRMALWGDAILLGVWGATLSSAVGSMLGAPRVLQALARDGVLPRPLKALGKGHGPDDTPRIGTILTMVVAMAAVYIGDLNLIAPVLSMFFLTTYGVLNITAGTERFLRSPSFRPRFKVHWSFSLLGALGCIAVMFLINAVATVVAFVFIALVFFWLQRRELETAWGDVRNGIWMAITRAGLMRIDSSKKERSWRPHPLVLSGAPTKRWHLIDLAASLTHNRGILSVAMVMTEACSARRQHRYERHIRNFLLKQGIQSLARVITADSPYEGAEQLVNAYGMGPLVPNTIILGNNENTHTREAYCEMIARFHARERNVLVVHNESEEHFGKRRTIDVWWGGLKGNGGLMMVLAYLLQTNHRWYDATVTVKMMVKDSKAAQGAKENLKRLIGNMRTGAKAQVIVANGRSFDEILHASSALADLVFLGLADPGIAGSDGHYADYFARMQERIKGLPTTVLVLAAENTQFDDILIRED